MQLLWHEVTQLSLLDQLTLLLLEETPAYRYL